MTHIPTSIPSSSGDDPQISDEEMELRKDLLRRIMETRQAILDERGGVPIPRELIDKLLEETRGGSA